MELNDYIEAVKNKQLLMPGTVMRKGSADAWIKYLQGYRYLIKDILEVGSFEGASTMFWLEFFPNAHVTCIDPFTGNPLEHTGNQFEPIFKTCETRFHYNLAPYAGRYTCLKSTSQVVLPLLVSQFGLIYIDGLHEEEGVKFDTIKCWDLCRVDGLLIWDDYDTEIYRGNSHKLRKTIDAVLKPKKEAWLEVFQNGQQLCIQKTR
jgi:hypothetical protein